VSAILIDSGVETATDLAGLLPAEMRERIDLEMLTEPPSAAAMRVLATIRDEGWHQHIYRGRIGYPELLEWARRPSTSRSVRVRVEIAASLGGHSDARPDLLAAAYALDESNFLAVLDALRIAREWVSA